MNKKKILSVDDSSIIRKIIRGSIEMLNYEFLEASDGKEALDILLNEKDNVALILLDWNMPGMDGFEFLKTVKNDRFLKGIPIMMVTTESAKENIIKAVQSGVANYLLKPFSSEELAKKILQCIGRA